jgi:hypothetical protein
MVLLGGGGDFTMGRALTLDKVPHNRLWMTIAKAMGHDLQTFGNTALSQGGPLDLTS